MSLLPIYETDLWHHFTLHAQVGTGSNNKDKTNWMFPATLERSACDLLWCSCEKQLSLESYYVKLSQIESFTNNKSKGIFLLNLNWRGHECFDIYPFSRNLNYFDGLSSLIFLLVVFNMRLNVSVYHLCHCHIIVMFLSTCKFAVLHKRKVCRKLHGQKKSWW